MFLSPAVVAAAAAAFPRFSQSAIRYGISALDAYLGREATEKVLGAARAQHVAEGRPPTDEELLGNVEIAQAISERIQNALGSPTSLLTCRPRGFGLGHFSFDCVYARLLRPKSQSAAEFTTLFGSQQSCRI